jgi:hypothetical protein
MPYYITKNHPDCKSGWATVSGDYALKGCHKTKAEAIAQMVAISQAEDIEPGGTHPRDSKKESMFAEAADNTYNPPQGVQNAAKRALKWIAEGKAGDGFTDVGRRRASQLASGDSISRDTVARMKSYFARHNVDKKATGFNSGEEGYPSPGRVAWDAWGGTAGQAWTNRINLEDKK